MVRESPATVPAFVHRFLPCQRLARVSLKPWSAPTIAPAWTNVGQDHHAAADDDAQQH
jgi:hypothetical protein